MRYFKTPEGVIFNEDNIVIQPDDNNQLWLEYVDFLTNDGMVENVNYEITSIYSGPLEIALWRLRVILRIMNLETDIDTALELLQEPNRTAAKYIWEYGTVIERYSPTVLFIQSQLGLTDLQVDSIFIQANAIII